MDIWGSARKSREELCWRSLVSFQLMWIGRGLQKVARWWNGCQYMMLRLVCGVLRMPVAILGLFFSFCETINSYRCVQFWHDFYTGEPTSFPEQDGGIVHVTTPDNTHRSRQTSVPPTEFEPAVWASERPQTLIFDHSATGIGHCGECWNMKHTQRLIVAVKIKWKKALRM